VIIPVAVGACLLLPACVSARPAPPAVSLVASPARVTLAGPARRTIRVTNSGSQAVVVDVGRAGFILDLRGRPKIRLRKPGSRVLAPWLTVRPRRIALRPGGFATLTVSSRLARRAEPGDHSALVLLTSRPRLRGGLSVRMRLGIVVLVRAPGTIVRRLRLLGLQVRRVGRIRRLELGIVNLGNVTEALGPGCLVVSLGRKGLLFERLRTTARSLLPRSRGLLEFRYRGKQRGPVALRIEPSGRAPCGYGLRRTYRARL
jgi:hypothetical protein